MEIVLPVVLLVVLGGMGALVARSLRRRKDFLQAVTPDGTELPDLQTEQRLTATLRRLWRDAQQGLPLVEAGTETLKLVFCPTDHAASAERYKTGIGKPAELALFGLATLAPGGIEAIRHQIVDADKHALSAQTVLLLRQGQFDNDYVVVCRLLSQRPAIWGELALTVWRAQVQEQGGQPLVIELAVPQETDLTENTFAHGSVRLFGYLP